MPFYVVNLFKICSFFQLRLLGVGEVDVNKLGVREPDNQKLVDTQIPTRVGCPNLGHPAITSSL